MVNCLAANTGAKAACFCYLPGVVVRRVDARTIRVQRIQRANSRRPKRLGGMRCGRTGNASSRWRFAILALAAMLCGTGLAYGQKQNKKNKKDAAATEVSTASLLPDNQAVDLLVSQMLGAWQAGDADGMRKFYADDVMIISGACEPPIIGWANYARAYQAQFARTSGRRLERINSYTKVMGDTAGSPTSGNS